MADGAPLQGLRAKASEARPTVSRSLLLNALSQIRDVVLILSRDRRILYGNKSADSLLAEGSPLQVKGGRLETSSAVVGQQLGRAIDSTCADGARSVLLLRRPSAPPLIVAISCLDDEAENVLLVARDSTLHPRSTAAALRTCFGLTRSEADVAAAIAAGESSCQIAERRGVSTNTIRTQLKTISAKLGCTGQAQISAIVHSVPIATD